MKTQVIRRFSYSIVMMGLVISLLTMSTSPATAENVSVEGVKIYKKSSDTWVIKGLIRNNGDRPIKGYVKIKFLSSSGDILASEVAWVNDLDPLKPGQAGPFKWYGDASDFSSFTDLQVIFEQDK